MQKEKNYISTLTEILDLQSNLSHDIQVDSVLFTVCFKKSKRDFPSAVLGLCVSVPMLTLMYLCYLCHPKNLNLELIPSLSHKLQLNGFLLFSYITRNTNNNPK